MPPVALDPNIEPIPDFNGPGYQAIRALIIAQIPDTTPEQAVEQIQAAYNADRQVRIAAWDEQVRQEQAEAEALLVEQRRDEEEAK